MRILITIISAIFISSCAHQPNKLTVKNTHNQDITDKVIILSYKESLNYINNPDSKPIVAIEKDGTLLATQNDDINKDGNIDEIAFLIDLKSNEEKSIRFRIATTGELDQFAKRTNIRFGNKKSLNKEITSAKRLKTTDTKDIQPIFQMEGPAWENDIVGFRNYYDARNGIDIFGKKTNKMALDSAGIRGQKYHSLDWWGMDNLKVGNSLGAGAIAIAIGDSIYRVGPCDEGNFKFITEGPVRAIFELTYKGIHIADRTYGVTHQISIYAGKYGYNSKVWLDGLQGDEAVVTGIVDLHNLALTTKKLTNNTIIATHGKQAYSNEFLGMAIVANSKNILKQISAPKKGKGIVDTHLLFLKANQPAEYSFLVGWEYQDTEFKSEDYFLDICSKEASLH